MTKVPLRAYIREIETIIEQKQTEEAIAHCRHILQTFPKHIDTYRMLGKAYLESKRYSNSADIFQRVLSAVPDDFVSHVGMSIIREDENNLDAAISHMERAFEGQPYNAAIQGELRRLYGRRDGMEPPKIHLTQGALARMYVKGNLFQQAIAELRAAIAEDPQRFDLRVLLAQMYAESDDYAKAIETAGSIITKLPYCLVANRILAQLLEKTERAKEAAVYKKQVIELDPYEAFVGPKTPTASNIPQQAVLIDQLIWDGGPAVSTQEQPEWAIAAGVDFSGSEPSDEGLPDWISETEGEIPALPGSVAEEGEPEEIPDWMQAAGWGPSTGEFDESKSAFSFEDDDADSKESDSIEAVAGNIPDWLQDMAPPGAIEDPNEVAEAPIDFPESNIEDSDSIEWIEEETEAEESDLPDWLKPAAVGAGAAIVSALSDDSESSEDEEDESLDIFDESGVSSDALAEEIPEWLEDFESEDQVIPDQDAISEIDELPDWLQETDEERSVLEGETELDEIAEGLLEATDDEKAEPEILDQVASIETDEIPDWLVAEDETAATEAEASVTAEESGEIPDWLSDALEEDIDADDLAETSASVEGDEIPDWLQETDEEGEPATELQEEVPDWLKDFSDDSTTDEDISQDVDEESKTILTATAAAAGAAILSRKDDETDADEKDDLTPTSTTEMAAEETLDWLQDESDESEPGLEDEIDVPDWLQDISPEATDLEPISSEAEALTTEAETGEIPDWLKEVVDEEDITSDLDEPTTEEEIDAATLPDWLQEVSDESEGTDKTEDLITDDIPEWLQDTDTEEGVSDQESQPEAPDAEAKTGEIQDWLSETSEEDQVIEVAEEQAPAGLQEFSEEDLDSEMSDVLETAAEVEGDPDATTDPDWIQEDIGSVEPVTEIEESISEELPTEEVPDWLPEVEKDESADAIAEEGPSESVAAEAEIGEIPDWLQETVSEVEADLDVDEGPEEEIDEAGLPDWLQDISDEAEEVVAEDIPSEGAADEIPEWIQEAVEEESEPEASIEEPDTGEIPDWLQETSEDIESVPVSKETDNGTTEEETPDWIQEIVEEDESLEEAIEGEAQSSEGTGAGIIAAGITGAAVAGAAALMGEDEQDEIDSEEDLLARTSQPTDEPEHELGEIESELPGWLQDIPDTSPVDYATSEETQSEDEIPAWLQDIGDEIPTIAGETEVSGETPAEPELDDIPDWLQDIAEEETLLAEDDDTPAEAASPEFDDAEAAMAWLESLAAKQGVSEDELLTSPDQRSETPPDWVKEATSEPVESSEPTDEEIPDWLSEPIEEIEELPTSEFQDLEPADETTSPLMDQVETKEDEVEIASEQPSDPQIDIPDWLQEMEEETPGDTEAIAPDELEVSPETSDFADDEISPETDLEPQVEEITDFEDVDAAMAWLESLAAKQGVSEEELITKPEQRSETPPDWVQETIKAETAPAPEASADVLDDAQIETQDEALEWILDAPKSPEQQDLTPEEPVSEILEEVVPATDEPEASLEAEKSDEIDFEDADAAMAWLESLAANQGVSEDELLTRPDERPETPPDWIQEISAEAEATPQSEIVAEAEEDLSEWIAEVPKAEVPEAAPVSDTLASSDEIDFADSDAAMAWLESLAAKQGVSEEELLTSPDDRPDAPPDWVQAETRQTEAANATLPPIELEEEVIAETEAPQTSIPEIPEDETPLEPPSWISDGDIPEDDDYSWLSTDVSEAISAEAETQIDLNEASLIQIERLPGVGFRRAQALTAYRDEHGNFSNFDELYNVPGLDEETIEILKHSVSIRKPDTPLVSDTTPEEALFTPQETEPEDELHQQQIEAQTKLMDGDLAGAVDGYDALIQKGQRLDQVIEDLQRASEQYPGEIKLLQKLGDACMRADRLQEALEAYAKAEDLFS